MSSIWTVARNPALAHSAKAAGYHNMLQLIQLRWIAVFGQVFTILFVWRVLHIDLPVAEMLAVIGLLVLLNLFSLFRPRRSGEVRNVDLLAGLLCDVAALTALLFLSGGATNPFVFLYPLQVTLGAMLLKPKYTWTLVGITTACFTALMFFYMPLELHATNLQRAFDLHVVGMLICFVLDVALIVVFMTRINTNLRRRDAWLADLRQRAAEEDHIVRMGLLASGAAHELGTPLATLSVILGDWKRMPPFQQDPDLRQEIEDMEAEVKRCKTIVTGILLSAGEARGEAPVLTTLTAFLDDLIADWRGSRPVQNLDYRLEEITTDPECATTPIVADPALKQVIHNVLDNALEASPGWVGFTASCQDGWLRLRVQDRGPGFPPDILAQFGKPYQSSKGRPGGGLGLFLVVNVLRKLGGKASAENLADGGAVVRLDIPLPALSLSTSDE